MNCAMLLHAYFVDQMATLFYSCRHVNREFCMHVISKKPFSDTAIKHPNQRQALEDMYRVLRKGDFSNPDELRALFPSLDNFKYEDKWWVFDVGGNHLRVIAFVQFVIGRIYVKHIFTHAEYDKFCRKYPRGK